MARITLLILLACAPARAEHEPAYDFAIAGLGLAGATALVGAAVFTAFDFKAMKDRRRPSNAHAVLELVWSQVYLLGGGALLAFGLDQHQPETAAVGGVMAGVAAPMMVHAMWAFNAGSGAQPDRRRRTLGGGLELGLALLELGVAGSVLGYLAYNPNEDVRESGFITVGAMAAVPLALGIHGAYLLGSRGGSSTVTLAPSLSPGGVGLAGRF